jgi:hypothetical protein
MADAKSRAKVQRLLGADFRPGDLGDLFLFARDHCDGRQSVTDIGDFVAHHNERDRGIITTSTRDWFTVVRYYMAVLWPHNRLPVPLERARMPPATRDYFKIAANRIDAKFIREKTGLQRKDAYDRLGKIADRLVKNDDGTWALPNDLTNDETGLIECVSSLIVVKPAFEAERLIDDFVATLKSNGLITKEEVRSNKEKISVTVQLFAIAMMHNCIVQIGEGTNIQLKATPEPDLKKIYVNAAIPSPNDSRVWYSAMFTSDLDPSFHCDAGLRGQNWDFEIELAPDRRLSRLG